MTMDRVMQMEGEDKLIRADLVSRALTRLKASYSQHCSDVKFHVFSMKICRFNLRIRNSFEFLIVMGTQDVGRRCLCVLLFVVMCCTSQYDKNTLRA